MNRCFAWREKKRKSCHHLEISHDFPVVFWGSCTDWPVPPPVATCYSQDAADSWWRSRWAQGLYHHRLLEDQWREKNPKNVEEEGANKQQAADLAKYECSDMLGPSLSDRSEGFSLHTKFVCVKALLFGHGGFSVLCMRTNPLVRSNKRFRSACGGEKTYTFAALIAHWCSITMENHHF